MSTEPHPAACPYCGGTTVNQAQPDYLVRPARLNDDGSIVVGAVIDGADFSGLSLLFCHGCNSTYAQPTEVPETFDGDLSIDYPETPAEGHPDYRGWGVTWTPVPTGPKVSFPIPIGHE